MREDFCLFFTVRVAVFVQGGVEEPPGGTRDSFVLLTAVGDLSTAIKLAISQTPGGVFPVRLFSFKSYQPIRCAARFLHPGVLCFN